MLLLSESYYLLLTHDLSCTWLYSQPLFCDKSDGSIDHLCTFNLHYHRCTMAAKPETHKALLSVSSSSKVARFSVTLSLVRHACVIAPKVTACSYCH